MKEEKMKNSFVGWKQCLLVVAFLCAGLLSASAQQSDLLEKLRTNQSGEGTVTVHQSAAIERLLGRPLSTTHSGAAEGQSTTMKVTGFRVQVYAGNNSRVARNEANAMAERVRSQFPELTVYTQFVNPRWLCRVGDFRSIEEADAVMRQLKATGMFKEMSIVRGQVNISY